MPRSYIIILGEMFHLTNATNIFRFSSSSSQLLLFGLKKKYEKRRHFSLDELERYAELLSVLIKNGMIEKDISVAWPKKINEKSIVSKF